MLIITPAPRAWKAKIAEQGESQQNNGWDHRKPIVDVIATAFQFVLGEQMRDHSVLADIPALKPVAFSLISL